MTFNNTFFSLSVIDQIRIIERELDELEHSTFVSRNDRQRAKRRANYIRRKATECGLLKEAE